MKKRIAYLVSVLLSFFLMACPDKDDRFWIFNNSNKDVICYVAITPNPSRICMDTLLPSIQVGEILAKNKVTSRAYLEEYSCDTIRIFFLDLDTINKYPSEQIRVENKILKRYDIAIKNFKNMN